MMKIVHILLSVTMVLVDSASLPSENKPPKTQDIQVNLEKIIDIAEKYLNSLPPDTLSILRKDIRHLSQTTNKCKEFFCEAETILASLEHHMFGEGTEIVRTLGMYNKHMNCNVVNQSHGIQAEVRTLLIELRRCGQKINSSQ
ncbi:hypothetical protein UPYG_G00126410 [Umbra pygmaea]|uniref:Interleukin-4 n=1 Tax=Umbra pygmaea TaxID=75934 RepID=A0ABD0XTK4_UMBPY